MEALVDQVEVISRQSPVLTIFEDTHWADPSSLELLGRLVDKIADLRVLLFVTFRPEFAAPWIGRPHVTALTINRLSPREVTALIEQVAGNRSLPANIRQDIVERADGIPLFVEEMTKAVLEVEGEGGTERAVPSIPLPALAVPASLHGSLMARLDRLGNAKAVAQIGAAIGREFSWFLRCGGTRLRRRWTRRLTASFRLACFIDKAPRLRRLICSGTLLFKMRPTAAAARAKADAARPARGGDRKSVSGHQGEPTGTAGLALHRGWPG